jgi:NifB/MoaA-like Fe-S oxidoreductase
MKPQSPQLAENTVPAQSIITAELNSGEKLFQAIKDLQKQAQHA